MLDTFRQDVRHGARMLREESRLLAGRHRLDCRRRRGLRGDVQRGRWDGAAAAARAARERNRDDQRHRAGRPRIRQPGSRFSAIATFAIRPAAFPASARTACSSPVSRGGGRTSTESRLGFAVSGNLFDVLEVRPEARTLLPRRRRRACPAGRRGGHLARHLGAAVRADPNVAGQTLRLGGVTFTVIGVAPAVVHRARTRAPGAFYVPLSMMPALVPARAGRPARAARRLRPPADAQGAAAPGGAAVARRAPKSSSSARTLQQAYPADRAGAAGWWCARISRRAGSNAGPRRPPSGCSSRWR